MCMLLLNGIQGEESFLIFFIMSDKTLFFKYVFGNCWVFWHINTHVFFIALTQQNYVVHLPWKTHFQSWWRSSVQLGIVHRPSCNSLVSQGNIDFNYTSCKKAPADQTGPKQKQNKEWPLAPLLFTTLPQTSSFKEIAAVMVHLALASKVL